MTDLQKFRFKLGDEVRTSEVVFPGDGVTRVFSLGKVNINTATVYLDDAEQASGFDLDTVSGTILMDTAPSDGQELRVRFTYSAFSDSEITDLVAEYGFNKAMVEAIDVLLFDSAKRANYKAGDKEVKNDVIFKNLKDLREIYSKKSNQARIVSRNFGTPPSDTLIVDLTRD
jgi:hypothetical protein